MSEWPDLVSVGIRGAKSYSYRDKTLRTFPSISINFQFDALSCRIFGLSSPWIPELARVWSSLPMLLISVPAIAAGILAKRLPETKDALLPETLEDAMMLDFRFAHKITHFSRRTF